MNNGDVVVTPINGHHENEKESERVVGEQQTTVQPNNKVCSRVFF